MSHPIPQAEEPTDRILTIPNALCAFRMLAAPFLVVLAAHEQRLEVVVLFVLMAGSDWLDGKIATRFNQRSAIGPALDSFADLLMYAGLIGAAWFLDSAKLSAAWPWFLLPLVAYLVAGISSLAKFRKWPSHHTRMAKISWFLVSVGTVVFLLSGSLWVLQLAMVTAALASLQSVAITQVLSEWTTDVLSVSAARRLEQERAKRR